MNYTFSFVKVEQTSVLLKESHNYVLDPKLLVEELRVVRSCYLYDTVTEVTVV